MSEREPTKLDRQIRALADVHRLAAGADGPLDDDRRLSVLRIYIEWVNEELAKYAEEGA